MSNLASLFGFRVPLNNFIIIITSLVITLQNPYDNIVKPCKNVFHKVTYGTLVNLAYYYDSLKSNFTKTLFNVPKHIKSNQYELEYYYHNKPYTIILNLDSNYIHRIYRIKTRQRKEDELIQSQEIATYIKRFLGPNEDCHNTIVSPTLLGFYEVEIMYMGEEFETNIVSFKEDEPIKIPN